MLIGRTIAITIGVMVLEDATGIFRDRTQVMFGFGFACAMLWFLPELWRKLEGLRAAAVSSALYIAGILIWLRIIEPSGAAGFYLEGIGRRPLLEALQGVAMVPTLAMRGVDALVALPASREALKPAYWVSFPPAFLAFFLFIATAPYLHRWLAGRNAVPTVALLLAWNGAVGVVLVALGRGPAIGYPLLALSVLVALFVYWPRPGVPLIGGSRKRQREIAEVGAELARQKRKMQSMLDEIERQ